MVAVHIVVGHAHLQKAHEYNGLSNLVKIEILDLVDLDHVVQISNASVHFDDADFAVFEEHEELVVLKRRGNDGLDGLAFGGTKETADGYFVFVGYLLERLRP